jgi:hypothetical protein
MCTVTNKEQIVGYWIYVEDEEDYVYIPSAEELAQ